MKRIIIDSENSKSLERERVTAVFDVGCEGQRHNQTERKEEGREKLEVNGFHSLDSATCQNK